MRSLECGGKFDLRFLWDVSFARRSFDLTAKFSLLEKCVTLSCRNVNAVVSWFGFKIYDQIILCSFPYSFRQDCPSPWS